MKYYLFLLFILVMQADAMDDISSIHPDEAVHHKILIYFNDPKFQQNLIRLNSVVNYQNEPQSSARQFHEQLMMLILKYRAIQKASYLLDIENNNHAFLLLIADGKDDFVDQCKAILPSSSDCYENNKDDLTSILIPFLPLRLFPITAGFFVQTLGL